VANMTIANRLGVSRSTVLGWRSQFAEDGVEGVGMVPPERGRKPTIPQEKIDRVVHDTQHTKPPDATHWSVEAPLRCGSSRRSCVPGHQPFQFT
jgi:transposase